MPITDLEFEMRLKALGLALSYSEKPVNPEDAVAAAEKYLSFFLHPTEQAPPSARQLIAAS